MSSRTRQFKLQSYSYRSTGAGATATAPPVAGERPPPVAAKRRRGVTWTGTKPRHLSASFYSTHMGMVGAGAPAHRNGRGGDDGGQKTKAGKRIKVDCCYSYGWSRGLPSQHVLVPTTHAAQLLQPPALAHGHRAGRQSDTGYRRA